MTGAELPDEDLVQEGLPGHVHEFLVKMEEAHLVHMSLGAQEALPLGGGAQQGHGRPAHQRVGMDVEAQGDGRQPQRIGTLTHRAQQRHVAQVDAVEKAEGDDG